MKTDLCRWRNTGIFEYGKQKGIIVDTKIECIVTIQNFPPPPIIFKNTSFVYPYNVGNENSETV
jgi:hypothetical protein